MDQGELDTHAAHASQAANSVKTRLEQLWGMRGTHGPPDLQTCTSAAGTQLGVWVARVHLATLPAPSQRCSSSSDIPAVGAGHPYRLDEDQAAPPAGSSHAAQKG